MPKLARATTKPMSLSFAIILYNAMVAGLVGVVLFWFAQKRTWLRFIFALVSLGTLAAGVAFVFCLSEWNPLRVARLLCYGWFLHVPAYLLIAAAISKSKILRIVCAGLLLLIAGVVIFSFWIEPFRLEVTNYRIASPKISRPIRIGLLADFQTDKFEEYERDSLRRLMEEQPDLIVMAGDYLQADSIEAWEPLAGRMNSFLAEINFGAPLGVYGVEGNTDFRRWPEIFRGHDVTTFEVTRTVEIDELAITGLSVEDSFDAQCAPAGELNVTDERFSIMLGHAPDFALSSNVTADLLVAGHTHGGQVRIPFWGPIVTFSRVPRSWAAGLTKINAKQTLVVSRGLGMERRDAPRIRFLCRPQLVFIELVPSE